MGFCRTVQTLGQAIISPRDDGKLIFLKFKMGGGNEKKLQSLQQLKIFWIALSTPPKENEMCNAPATCLCHFPCSRLMILLKTHWWLRHLVLIKGDALILAVPGKVPESKQWQAAWAKRASIEKPQAKLAPSDSPWERPCFNSGTVPCTRNLTPRLIFSLHRINIDYWN